MRLYEYINFNEYMKLDILLRKKALRIVYKGRSAFVYPT